MEHKFRTSIINGKYTGKVLCWDLGGYVSLHPQIQTLFKWDGDFIVPLVPNKYTTDVVQFIVDNGTSHCWSKQTEGYAVVDDSDIPTLPVLFNEGDIIGIFTSALICKIIWIEPTDKFQFLYC